MTPPDIDDAVADLLAAHPTGRVLLTIAERLDALVERAAGAGRLPAVVRQSHIRARSA